MGCLRTEDGGRRTEDGGQRTDDRGRRTEDGGRICSFRLPSSDLCLLSSSLEVRINETQLDGKMDQFDG